MDIHKSSSRSPRHRTSWLARLALVLGLHCAVSGAEKVFDFGSQPAGSVPAGFRSLVYGEGQPGDWQVKEISLPSVQDAVDGSSVTVRQAVLAQLARNRAEEHFPLLVYEGERYHDFTMSVRVQSVEGEVDQMAGVAFRLQNETNFYALRISSLGNTVRFYKVVDGIRTPPIGVSASVPRGVWHELKVSCEGNQIRCWFNGQELFPPLTDNSFTEGHIGLWTKSDSVSYFKDLKLVYRPRVMLAERLVQEAMERHRRLLGLEIFAAAPGSELVTLVAGSDVETVGRVGGRVESEVVREGTAYYGKEGDVVSVVLPLRDRNGDPVAAVRLTMKGFAGQTQANALARAQPIFEQMNRQVRSLEDLLR
jgi:hypothetical protein